jgi:hypothetical protein
MREARTRTVARRDGLYIDFTVLDYQAAIRGVNMRQLAAKAGFPEESLSRARRGRRIRESTLRKLIGALRRIPVIEGAELLVADPPPRGASVIPSGLNHPADARPLKIKKGVNRNARGRTPRTG